MGKKGILKEYASVFDLLHRVFDLLAVIAGCLAAYWLRHGTFDLPGQYREALLVAVVLGLLSFRSFGLYQSWRGISLTAELQRVTWAWGAIFIVLAVIAFLLKLGHEYSRQWAVFWLGSTWVLLVGLRATARIALRWVRSGGANYRRVVIVGATSLSAYAIRQINDMPWTGLKVVGVFDEASNVPHVGVFEGVPVWGGLNEVARYVDSANIDQVWLCLPLRAEDDMKRVLGDLRNSTADIRFVPDIFGFNLLNHSMTEVAGIPVINLSASPMEGWNRVVKELEDRFLALLILIAISPIMLAIAIGVKLSSRGPCLFKQLRHGWDGRPIEVWKFRTMKLHSEKRGSVTQATRIDNRVTKFGAFLRRTSLDELPQFVNVLQGRMSIVGPRPHAIEHNEQYKDLIDKYMLRHKVKPGITGWAQVNGYRGETDTVEKMEKRVEYDLYYIENWSLWFDLKIIFLTFFKGFVHKNAY